MADFRPTEAQRDAINARNGSVLVSAAAGSGKTAVLVNRIISAITDEKSDLSLDKMLIVTFTRAASAEMRERIEKALDEKLKTDPYNMKLLNQKQQLRTAFICTIDSFCGEMVRRYFYKLGIQADYRIMDEAEKSSMKNQALDNVLNRYYDSGDEGFLRLIDATCSYKNDGQLRKRILDTSLFLDAIPFAEKWCEKALGYYLIDFDKTPFCRYLMHYAVEGIKYALTLVQSVYQLIDSDNYTDPDKLEQLRNTIRADENALKNVEETLSENNPGWNEIYKLLKSVKYATAPRISDEENLGCKDKVSKARTKYKNKIKEIAAVFVKSIDELTEESKENYPVISSFIDCVLRFREEYFALKAEKNVLDFPDVEQLMVRLLYKYEGESLVYTDISEEISEQFQAIMVDEFQDNNAVQDLIFRGVSHDKYNIFVVGDVKQSIYGFRQARPDIFIDYKNRYPLYDREKDNYPSKIILDRNFRSREGITESCNFVFRTIMSKEVGGIEYNDEEKLVYGADYPENSSPNMEFLLIDSSDVDPEKNEDKLVWEARRIAEKIKHMIYDEKLTVKGSEGERPLEFGDIAILLRSPSGQTRRSAVFNEVFAQYSIPIVSEGKSNFFDANEIKVMLNILRVIDNPVQDIPVLSVVMSQMFGFSADDIAKIRTQYRRYPIYNAIKMSAAENPKCARIIEYISKLRTIAVTTTVDRLIGIIMQTTGFDAMVMAVDSKPAGNLCLLQEYARSFAKNGYKSLTSFINYINRMQENGDSLGVCSELGDETLKAVRLVSIHKSKGLEFPVCFVSTTSTQFNKKDTYADLLLDVNCGVGMRLKKGELKYETTQRKAMSMMKLDNLYSEEIRILYVALTRAKERLVITAVQDDPNDYLEKLSGLISSCPIPSFVVKNMNCFADWLFSCALLNPACEMSRDSLTPDETYFNPKQGSWRFEIVKGEYAPMQFAPIIQEEAEGEIITESDYDKSFMDDFARRVSFEYPAKELCSLPQKITASELSHRDNRIFNKLLRKPSFIESKKSDGAEKGTAFHNFMERCDLVKAGADSAAEALELADKNMLTIRQTELLDYDKLDSFLHSDLIERVLNSEQYYREFTFTVEIDAADYDSQISDEFAKQKLVMQGAVDLIFIEDGEAVIVDYKTDRVKDIEKLGEMYHKQLELYKTAVEQALELKVKETVIYSVYLGEVLEIK